MAHNKLTLVLFFFVTSALIFVSGQTQVVNLNENNWRQILQNEWMIEFYAPWCPACKGLQPIWHDFATFAPNVRLKVGQVDVTTSPGLSGRFMVTALPTIFHVLNGEFRQYKGTRDKNSFVAFIEEKKWKSVDPIPSWKAPDTLQMSAVASFFKLSQTLRTIHNYLMEEYGLPTWGSYLIFAIATIILGALLGLILVCIIDLVYPPKCTAVPQSKEDYDKKKKSDDELADEDIKDDLLDDAANSASDKGSGSESGDKKSSTGVKKRKPRKAD